MSEQSRVYLVDDDEAVRDSVELLLETVGTPVSSFPDACSFLAEVDAQSRGCAVLDVRMPGMSGMVLFRELRARGVTLPVLFVTGHGDVPMAVEAMRDGAFDFIEKPFREELLLDRVQQALAQDAVDSVQASECEEIQRRVAELTPRELEIMSRIVNGKANKVIAVELDLSPRTVELHRSRVMEKMQARSLAHLVRMHFLISALPGAPDT